MADEALTLGGIKLYGGAPFDLEVLDFTPAAKRPQFADNADADGEVLVREAHYTNSSFEIQVRVSPQANMDTALTKLGELRDAIQACERIEGGAPTEWKPAGATATYTYYAIIGEETGLPIVAEGDDAGYFVNAPVLRFRLICRPFGYTPERVVKAATESGAEPLQVAYVGGIKGDVPAEGRLVLTDKATQDRRYAEYGQDVVESEVNPSLLLKAITDLKVTGYAGESSIRTGSYSTNVVKATLTPTPVVLCSTGSIKHVGSYRLKLRCQISGEEGRFRASYRVGDGPWIPLPWAEPQLTEKWCEVDLGEAFLEEAGRGEQVSEIRIEGKVESGGENENVTGYIDFLNPMPTRRYGIARAPLRPDTPTTVLVADLFNQADGAATGKVAERGGTYAAVANSDTTDFTISGGKLKRTAVIDTGTIGSLPFEGRGIGTSKELTDLVMRTDFKLESTSDQLVRFGHLISYVNNTNFILIVLVRTNAVFLGWQLAVYTPAGGVLGKARRKDLSVRTPEGSILTIVEGNTAAVYVAGHGGPFRRELTVEDALIGAKGKAYAYDECFGGSADTRLYDNLAIWEPAFPPVCESGQSLEIRHDGAEREDSAGTYWSPVPEFRGAHFELDPAGDSKRINRLVAKMRRNDNKLEPDSTAVDKQTLEVLARERFLMPR